MNPKDFIKTRLNELRNIFQELSSKYKFNPTTDTHIVDVRPIEFYSKNMDYIKYEADFSFEFDNLFYPETILFISEYPLTEIGNPDFVFGANQFSEELQRIVPPLVFKNPMVETHFDFDYALAA